MLQVRKLEIRCLLLILAIATLLLGGCDAFDLTLEQGERRVEIGEFQSKDAGMRAAIKRLAVEVERHPNQDIYRIVWIGPFSDETETARESIDRRALLYCGDGPVKTVGYEHDVLSGI